jgi:quercetin dioxygenase-like cupin family protein
MRNSRGRVFLRGITSKGYGLRELRQRQRLVPRVLQTGTSVNDANTDYLSDVIRPRSWRGLVKQALGKVFATSHDVTKARAWGVLKPGGEPFLTQTLQVQFIELSPGGASHGHWHQNEAVFYILEGHGYEVHDGRRYDWEKDDVVVVHNDCVHKHHNADKDRRALVLVLKAKSLWMYLGLLQQGHSTSVVEDEKYGPPEDWSCLWTPGVQERKKVIKPAEVSWEMTRDGLVRILSSWQQTNVRIFSVDIYQQLVPVGGRSAKHWHMADEVLYVLSGRGYSLHWDVEAEASDRYQARIAREPSRWDFMAGNLLYIPQNTVHQHFNADPREPLVLLSAQNRVFKLLGYDSVVYLENAPEYRAQREVVSAMEGSMNDR